MAAASFGACVDASSQRHGTTSSGGGFDKGALAQNLGEQIYQTYVSFAAAADALAAATQSYAASLSSSDRDAVRQAWRDAMLIWQRAEVMQVGPAGAMGKIGAGEDRRDQIYSFPMVNPCRVDQELVEGQYADSEAFAVEQVNVRGLDALEYLLFHEGAGNDCQPQVNINANGTWNAILGELEQRRADYSVTVAALVSLEAKALRDRWTATNGDFVSELTTPSDTYPTDQDVLNAIGVAMHYLDTETKDLKLAVPSGLTDCVENVCPTKLEHRFAGFSKQAVIANLEGFRTLFLGGPPEKAVALGFDDLLIAIGQSAVAEEMAEAIQSALNAAATIDEDTLGQALASDPDSVRDLHAAVKQITDVLKSDFITMLDFEPPNAAAGDND
jgi:predicted lipoprotein